MLLFRLFLTYCPERAWNQASDKQKIYSIEDALQTLQKNLQKGMEISGIMINKDTRDILQSAKKDEILKGQSVMDVAYNRNCC